VLYISGLALVALFSLYGNFKILGAMSLDTEITKQDFQKRKWAPQQMRKPQLLYVIRKRNYKVQARSAQRAIISQKRNGAYKDVKSLTRTE
jgi:hypothetical protein